jgi:hypothetical protein
MKIRNGFVSNSSSSSFLVGILPECITIDDFLQKGLIDLTRECEITREHLDDPVKDWKTYSEEMLTNRDCIKRLWESVLSSNNKADLLECISDITNGCVPESTFFRYDYQFVDTICMSHNISNTYREIYGDKIVKKIEKNLERYGDGWNSIVGEALIRDFFAYFDNNVYEINYSDHDCALMEHGAFWDYVYHVRFSNH